MAFTLNSSVHYTSHTSDRQVNKVMIMLCMILVGFCLFLFEPKYIRAFIYLKLQRNFVGNDYFQRTVTCYLACDGSSAPCIVYSHLRLPLKYTQFWWIQTIFYVHYGLFVAWLSGCRLQFMHRLNLEYLVRSVCGLCTEPIDDWPCFCLLAFRLNRANRFYLHIT